MLDAPPATSLGPEEADGPQSGQRTRPHWWQSLQAASTRRALLLTALGGLLIAGLITALPGNGTGRNIIGLNTAGSAALGLRGNDTFDHAKSGTCLDWPESVPDAARIVDCADEHRFEVAEALDMRTFPGSEYGADAAPPSEPRIRQISQEQCEAAASQYLGEKYDPNGRFSVSLVWSGEKAWRQSGERRMLCGLQLAGPGNHQMAIKGKVADLDQSKVWPAGTCLGIDAATNQPTDIPTDCAQPHAMEVTGAVDLAEKFPGPLPPDADQQQFVKDSCTQKTDDYLAPVELRKTTLTLIYSSISLPSWTAGSKQVSCSIGATLGNGGWSTMINSAKGPLLINGQPPQAVPDIPADRLEMPPIPLPLPDTSSQTSTQIDLSQTDQSQGTQHMPGQQAGTQTQTQTQNQNGSSSSSNTAGTPPPAGNTFLNGAPPPPGAPLDGGLPPAGVAPGPAPAPGGPPPGDAAQGPPPAAGPAPAPAEPAPAPGPVLPPGP